ncbi:MAG TPA: hypothetical protein VM848_00750 [Acidimicrobiia bacterium]|nr:hypothetical protein [Acidimicrobiia bacterium]
MIGHTAERVLAGQTSHVDFDDPYSGLQAVLHAAVFRRFGVDLAHLRYLLVAGFCVWGVAAWAILRRRFQPISASIIAAFTGVGSLLTYPSPMPSWYATFTCTFALWMVIRWTEAQRYHHLFLAGVALGTGILFKTTAIYGLGALVVALGMQIPRGTSVAMAVTRRVLIFSPALPVVWLSLQNAPGRSAAYFALPVIMLLVLANRTTQERERVVTPPSPRVLLGSSMSTLLGISLPILFYIVFQSGVTGAAALFDGWFTGPASRLSLVTYDPPSFWVTVLVLINGVILLTIATRRPTKYTAAVLITVMASLFVVNHDSLNTGIFLGAGYAVSVLALWCLRTRSLSDLGVLAALMAGFVALVGIPFYAAAYVGYAGPVIGIAAALLAAEIGLARLATVASMLVGLATVSPVAFGVQSHGAMAPTEDFVQSSIPRVSLVTQESLSYYADVVAVVGQHRRGLPIWAGPDLPHIYFLTQSPSVTRHIYEFSDPDPYGGLFVQIVEHCVMVVVLNSGQTQVSPAPRSELLGLLRTHYDEFEIVAGHEIRWTNRVHLDC